MNVTGYVALTGPLNDNVSAALETVVSWIENQDKIIYTSV